jgi:hypothetical protein
MEGESEENAASGGRFNGDDEEEVLFCNVVILGAVIRFDCIPLLRFG